MATNTDRPLIAMEFVTREITLGLEPRCTVIAVDAFAIRHLHVCSKCWKLGRRTVLRCDSLIWWCNTISTTTAAALTTTRGDRLRLLLGEVSEVVERYHRERRRDREHIPVTVGKWISTKIDSRFVGGEQATLEHGASISEFLGIVLEVLALHAPAQTVIEEIDEWLDIVLPPIVVRFQRLGMEHVIGVIQLVLSIFKNAELGCGNTPHRQDGVTLALIDTCDVESAKTFGDRRVSHTLLQNGGT